MGSREGRRESHETRRDLLRGVHDLRRRIRGDHPGFGAFSGEARFLSLGLSAEARLLVVSYTERAGRIRIIHARVAVAKERNAYESG